MKRKLILASASPRRREILEQAGFSFTVFTADVIEDIVGQPPAVTVEKLSEKKALAAIKLWEEQNHPEDPVILAADTVVALGEEILLKPADRSQAVQMLRRLQGRDHQVYTGVTLVWYEKHGTEKEKKQLTFSEKTQVTFYPMTEEEIQAYVDTGEGEDKAGAYAIQGLGMKYIQKIEGDYHNVVGLPLAAIYQKAKGLGIL